MYDLSLFRTTLTISAFVILIGIFLVMIYPTSLEGITIGMFIISIGIFASLGAFHYLDEPHYLKARRKRHARYKKEQKR